MYEAIKRWSLMGGLVDWIALYISSKGLNDVGSASDFPLSRESWLEDEIVFMDAVCDEGGGVCNEKKPMSEEYFNKPTPMF